MLERFDDLIRIGAVAIVVAMSGTAAAQAPVQDNARLGERIDRLEQLMSSETLIELHQSVQALQREVQNLRGEVELQGHTLTQLKQRQRELYLDIDRRLQQMETAGAGAPAPAPAAAAPAMPPAAPAQPGTTTAAAAPGQVSTVAPPVDSAEEQRSYQAAFDLLKSGRYDQAAQAFRDFLAKYPSGQYADNANYWLAEAYYVTRKFEPALKQFESLVADYPQSQKLTHALLKIGYIHDELGQREQAEQILDDLIKRFPDSTAAGLARKRLQRIRSG
ncbi:MAG TPA: tol-pal system protein YbgF [Gammaproteobacteria bacterium]|nr:tol-pal system protein YbgF [Gammaproteobacteria bacterium]